MTRPDDWLGLGQTAPGRWTFELTSPLARFDGKLYGGTGLAVVTAAMEAETGRGTLWSTVQFAASADVGEQIDCHVEVLANGRRTSQVRVTATVGDRLVLAGLGATGEPRTGGLEVQVGAMPEVAAPEESPRWAPKVPFTITEGNQGWLGLVDVREIRGLGPGMALWARMRGEPQTRSSMGFLADIVPSAVVRAAGRAGGGTSLDNSIRFGPAPDTDWVLVDLDPYFASGGYVHGAARLWGPDGTLLAVASQTAVAVLFD
ncbi:MAG TPA: thioesterase family protein [Acidimicrobiales bacterium]